MKIYHIFSFYYTHMCMYNILLETVIFYFRTSFSERMPLMCARRLHNPARSSVCVRNPSRGPHKFAADHVGGWYFRTLSWTAEQKFIQTPGNAVRGSARESGRNTTTLIPRSLVRPPRHYLFTRGVLHITLRRNALFALKTYFSVVHVP